ncbi:MAG: hypothetical protein FIA82_10715 [Melioribacter sp.]|nr:hypothetical protein [Melioribacter sp.]
MTKVLNRLFILIILLQNPLLAQIKVTSLPQNQRDIFDTIFFDKNDYRNVELINSEWKVYHESDPEKKVAVSIPAIFEGEEYLIFEKQISLTETQIQSSQLILGFLGINYSAEISINGYNIYKHSGGSYPFELALPKDILKENSVITIKISNKLDSEYSVPSTQRFLFSSLSGGIIRDVYLKTVSTIHITNNLFSYSFDQNLSKAILNFKIGIGNSDFKTNSLSSDVIIRINLFSPGSTSAQSKGDFVQIISQEDNEVTCRLEINNPQLWSPQTPINYLCDVSLIRNGQVIDKSIKQIAFYQLKKDATTLTLNGSSFSLQGTTYLFDETSLRRINAYNKIKDDLTLIKNTGFNVVRFSKQFPNPYAVKLCQELGLFAMIELPINSVPEEILSHNDYRLKAARLIKNFLSSYSEYSNTIIAGVGSSFLPNSEISSNFISNQSNTIKGKGFLSYASFIGIQTAQIQNLDFYGIELYSPQIDEIKDQLQKSIDALGKNSVSISEVSYPNYKGSTSGYLTKYSSDAQAKYLGDMIDLSRQLKLSGIIINSLFEYSGEYASLYGGYSVNNIYKFGLLDKSRNLNTIGYKVLAAKLSGNSKVTIPIGTRKDDNPIIFIILALLLSVIMAVLINTKKKFREDCTRALLRPYNFFADVRDHRIISGVHTAILMLIQAGSVSLLMTILLYFYKSNFLLEKIVLSFGHHSLLKFISYLSWNPQVCFAVLFILIIIKFALISLVIKFASFFIKTRVEFTSISYTVIWTFLPFTILLPVELILFKVLVNGNFSIVVIIFLILFMLWILQRLLKGIYVIFDVRPMKVYIYSFFIIILVAGGVLLKYQLTSSTFYYITNSFKQYNSMIF